MKTSLIQQYELFMHYYFWVFLVIAILGVLINYKREEKKTGLYKFSFQSAVGIVLWIMSWSY